MLRGLVITSAVLLSACNFEIPKVPPENPVYSAAQMAGMHERRDRQELKSFLGVDPSRTEWCAAFVNAVLNKHNIPGSESVSEYPLMARSFLSWGESVDVPQIGDIIVFPRGNAGWQGHVGFYVMTSEDGKYYYILGGNQTDSISIERYSVSSALSIRRSNTEYSLPL